MSPQYSVTSSGKVFSSSGTGQWTGFQKFGRVGRALAFGATALAGVASAAMSMGTAQGATSAFYVSNYASNAITEVLSIGASGYFATDLDKPNGLAFDSAGNPLVSDAGNSTLSKITPSGAVSTFASGLGTPQGLAISGG